MGAGEAIFLNTRGNICEATGSNIFFVKDEVLVTPPLSSGCLAGVTRDLVLLLAKNLGIATSEQDLPFSVVSEVSEAFLTSTTREVQAIAQIDDIIIPNSSGIVVKHLSEAYTDLRRRECDP
jgi:branched-chain amino acid aminotransferase